MPTPSKFTAETRRALLEALELGADRNTACAMARIGPATLRRWMVTGASARAGSKFQRFHEDVLQAEASPKLGALRVVRDAWADKPELAWKFAERRIEGFAPPQADRAPPAAPQIVVLTLDDGRPLTPAGPTLVLNEAEADPEHEAG